MSHVERTRRALRLTSVTAVCSLILALLVGGGIAPATAAADARPSSATQPVASAIVPAANLSLFRPGNIINDSTFFNAGTMTAGQIQSFLQSRVPNCQSGYTCLKDKRDNSRTTAADAMCGPYAGAQNELASTIIYKVAQACGINPQVLIVTLQKEQGLVLHTWPSEWRYDKAMGQGCPDTAGCDVRYLGFFNQVYGAAWQFKRYANPPGTSMYYTWYAPGRTWDILYNPNRSCGSSPVFIENQATANLYYYTPYQPNASALRAGYGEGDACGAYGNRNFYQYFVDWFGSPTGFSVTGSIGDYWNALGGASGYIGAPTSAMKDWPGGWSQSFVGADLYLKSSQSVHEVGGSIRREYFVVGEPRSGLGWPTGNQIRLGAGWYQQFEGGRIFVRPEDRGVAVAAPMSARYEGLGNVSGWLGWPSSRAVSAADGSQQQFDGGVIFAGPRALVALSTPWVDQYSLNGGIGGPLGWPSTEESANASGTQVLFDRGLIQRSSSGSYTVVSGAIGAAYIAGGGPAGPLGLPRSAATSDGPGTRQEFAGGTIYSSAAGTFAVSALRVQLAAAGGVAGVGYPVAPERLGVGSASQDFASVTLAKGAAGSFTVRGAIRDHYAALGGAASSLAAPIGPERYVGSGWIQDFAGGQIACGPNGTFTVPAPVSQRWKSSGEQTGRLGWPTAPAVAGSDGWSQSFAGGAVYASSSATGAGGAVYGSILGAYAGAGGPSALGYPVSAETIVPGAWKQQFERGVVFVPSLYPASTVSGPIYDYFSVLGGEAVTGLPRNTQVSGSGGAAQEFEQSSIYTSPQGTYFSAGAIRNVYHREGGPGGILGWPVQSMVTSSAGARQAFAGGGIFSWSAGTFVTRGALGREYLARGGEQSSLGWPLAGEALVDGLWQQRFQNGTLVLMADGSFQVR